MDTQMVNLGDDVYVSKLTSGGIVVVQRGHRIELDTGKIMVLLNFIKDENNGR